MGIDIEQYRLVIGLFGARIRVKHLSIRMANICIYIKLLMTNLNLDVVTVTIIIIILWMCSNDIERNPGPTNILHRDLELCHLNIQSLKK